MGQKACSQKTAAAGFEPRTFNILPSEHGSFYTWKLVWQQMITVSICRAEWTFSNFNPQTLIINYDFTKDNINLWHCCHKGTKELAMLASYYYQMHVHPAQEMLHVFQCCCINGTHKIQPVWIYPTLLFTLSRIPQTRSKTVASISKE